MNVAALDRYADRYLESVMNLFERLQRDESVDCQTVHKELADQLRRGIGEVSLREDWQHVTYALAALTDELMVELPWPGRNWWNDNVLEANLFGTRMCSERFFAIAKETMRDRPEVLRVFHDCVLLGFRGFYAMEASAPAIASELDVPPTLEQWVAEVQDRLSNPDTPKPAIQRHQKLSGAPPLPGGRNAVWWSVASGTLVALNITIYTLLLR